MTDPFSVGAGAAGLVSLGITVCQGLVAYYGPFTQYDPETKSFVKRAETLNTTLEQLETLLKTVQDPLHSHIRREIDIVSQRVEDCKEELQSLSERLTKCRGCNPTTTIQKNGWYYARKALYPFKRGTIVALVDTVSGLQSNLDTALQILNLAQSKRVENQSTLTLSLTQSMSTIPTDNSATLSRIEQTQQQMYQEQQQIYQAIMSSLQISSTTTRAPNPSQRRLPPATLQSFCDQQQTVNLHVQNKQQFSRVKSTRKASSCTCPQNKNRLWKIFQILPSHRYDCPLYLQGEDFILFQKQFPFCNWFLQRSIVVTLGASTAAGAFTMKPPFGVRRVVPDNAPAFQLMKDSFQRSSEHNTSDSIMKCLRKLFDEGKALPRDTLYDGENLLHFALLYIFYQGSEDFQVGLRILQELVDVYHIPVNEGWQKDRKNYTFLDTFISHAGIIALGYIWLYDRVSDNIISQMVPFVLKTLAGGGEITNATLLDTDRTVQKDFTTQSTASRILPFISNQVDHQVLEFSDLDIAILQRSEQELKRLVEFHTGEGIELRTGVLLSAIPWPRGFEIIVNSSAICCPRYWFLLHEAILEGQQGSVQLLLSHGWPIPMHAFGEAAGQAYQPELFQMIVMELYKRRQHLLHLVKANLSLELLGELSINEDTKVLDCDFDALRAHLRDHAQVIPEEIFPVYQYVDYNTQAAETLYEAGFTNIEAGERSPFFGPDPRSCGFPRYLEFCSWLQDKGGSIHRSCRKTLLSPVHYIANALGAFLDWQSTCWEPTIARHAKFLRAVLTDTGHRDSCFCACSDAGCLPSDVLMREMIRRQKYRRAREGRQIHHMAAKFIGVLCSQGLNNATSVCESLAPAVFRSCLFNELDITHTCMAHDLSRHIQTKKCREIARIHSEERHLINRLNELALEVEAKYKEMKFPLPEFLTGYFDTKLKELRAEEKVFDEEEAQRMESVGVIVRNPVQKPDPFLNE